MGLFSWVTLLAHQSQRTGLLPIRQAAWYVKSQPTFADAIAGVRSQIWGSVGFLHVYIGRRYAKPNPNLLKRLFEAVSYST